MPSISMFFGIIIYIFWGEDKTPHKEPHIHARYQNYKASIAIKDGDVLAGELPHNQLQMVQVWVKIHQEELLANWELAKEGSTPYQIKPLS